jgi:Raf kinase inhibitor-like YbhB/YbcL family protein
VDRTAPGRARPAGRAGRAGRTGLAGRTRRTFARLSRRPRLTRLTRRADAAVVALCCTVALAGCADITISAPVTMTVSSGAFQRDVMPPRFTCSGPTPLTPPLSWAGAPQGTKSIAVVLDDSDAPITPYVYWIVFNIGPATSALLEGQLPPGARLARNSAGRAGYNAPCPGASSHFYRFTVYALNTVLNLPNGASLESTWQAIAAATIGRGRLAASATSEAV